jgi:hypothetical protein
MSEPHAEEQVINQQAAPEISAPSAEPFGSLQGSASMEFYSPDPSYPWAKTARAAFDSLTDGEVELLSNVYKGDDQRHQVFHRSCGHHSWISLRELETLPRGQWCPHCHATGDLLRFGTMENLQVSVYRESGHAAYIFASNPLGSADEQYIYWCVRHRRSYEASFAEFQRTKGEANGCPLCAKAAG